MESLRPIPPVCSTRTPLSAAPRVGLRSVRSPSALTLATWLCRCSLWLALLCGAPAFAQSTANPAPTQANATQPNPAQAVLGESPDLPASAWPDTIYLRNERGDLVPVLGWKYEDFAELFGRRSGDPARPNYETTRCELILTERPEVVQAELSVVVRLARSGWTAVPLQLDQLKLQGAPVVTGGPRHWLRRDPQSGWWLWVEGQADQEVTIGLSGIVTPLRLGEQRRLELNLPMATESRVELDPLEAGMVVDFGGQRGQAVGSGGGGQEASDTANTSAATGVPDRWEARGLAGNTLIRWQPAGAPTQPVSGIWEAVLNLDLRVDGPRTVSALGDLELTAYGQPLHEFRLMLPNGTQLLPQDPLDPTVRYDVAAESSSDTTTVMKFRLRSPQLKVRVRFQAVTTGPENTNAEPANAELADAWLRCADYTVVGVLRQTGRVRLFASDDWVVQWLDTAAARTTDPGTAAGSANDELLAAVAIYQQPCGLGLKIGPRESRVDVEPDYWLKFQRQDVELTGRLTYHIRGAKATRLQIDCTGWEDIRVSSLGTGSLATGSLGPTVVDGSQPITIQLPSAVRGDLEVMLTAHRRLPTETGRMSIPLPRPTGSLLPTKVVLATTGNRTVTPVMDEMPSAAPETVSTQLATELVAEMAGMRTVGLRLPRDAAVDRLVLDVATHQREIDVQQVNRIRVGTRSIQVRQIFSYSVAYEPLSSVTLEFPANLNPATEISWAVNGVRVTPTERRPQINVPVTAAGAGSFEVVASYAVPFPSLSSGPLPLTIPLIGPQGAEITAQEAHWFRDAGALRLEPYVAGGWQTDEDLRRRIGCELALTTSQPRDQCTVLLRPGLPGETPRTSIHGGWLQTWLSDGVRFDRAVFDVETRERTLMCRMPRGLVPEQCVVTVNGSPQTADSSPAGVLTIRLPELRDDRALVEIAYRVPYRPEGWRASVDLPQLQQANWIGRWIWQVVVGPDEHVYATSINLTPLDRWNWQGWYWARSATWQQADLESWLKASRQPPIPAASHQYTFTSLRPADTAQLWLLQQRWVLIIGAGLAVLMLLAWTQYPVLRHWGLTVPLAFALLCLGIWAPTPALMLGQAAVVGVLAFLVAQLWTRIVSSRRQPVAVGSNSTRTIIKPASHMRPPSSVASAASGAGER